MIYKYKILLFCFFQFALFFSLLAQSGGWVQMSAFAGLGRYNGVAFSIGNKGYVGTGIASGGYYTKDFWQYDPTTDSWSQQADFAGKGRADAVGFSIGNYGYIGTGDSVNATVTYFSDFWQYDPGTNTWTQKANFGGGARWAAVGFGIGSNGYIGTGNTGSCNGGCTFNEDFWEYSPSSNTWTQKANFGGGARAYSVGFNIGNNGYIGTGQNANSLLNDFWQYNPSSNSWIQEANFLGNARFEAVGFSIGTKGFIAAGYTGNGTGNYNGDCWEYNSSTNMWNEMDSLVDSSGFLAGYNSSVGFSIGNLGYIATGDNNGNPSTDVWSFDPSTALKTGFVDTTVCFGDTLMIPFIVTGTFNSDNQFWIEVSDSNGVFNNNSFGYPAYGDTNGYITGTVLFGPGSHFRVRVHSTEPYLTGSDNGFNISVFLTNPPTVLSPVVYCQNEVAQSLTATGQNLLWYAADSGGVGNSVAPLPQTAIPDSTSYFVTQTMNGCESARSQIVVYVDSLLIQQNIQGDISITPLQLYPYFINTTDTGVNLTWSVTNGIIQSGQGTNSISVVWASTGPYKVTLIQTSLHGGCTDTTNLIVTNNACAVLFTLSSNNPSTLCSGDTEFVFVQINPPATYQWVENGTNILGQTGDTLAITTSGSYQVQVTSGGCTKVSAITPVTFIASPVIPIIDTSITNNACNLQPVTLTLNNSYQTYLWSTGATTSFITVNPTHVTTYTVTVSNISGCTATASHTVNVSILNLHFVTQPINQNVNTGNNAMFFVLSSDSNANYKWQTNLGLGWQNISNAGQYSGATNDTLIISSTYSMNNNQIFRCIAIVGSCSDTSNDAILSVNNCQTIIISQPTNQTVNIGSTAKFIVATSITATYQWQSNLGLGYENINNAGQYSGATTDTLTVDNLTTLNNNQNFRCLIISGLCNDTSDVSILSVNNNTGIINYIIENKVSIFPNPTNDLITIYSPGNVSSVITLYDVNGQIILTQNFKGVTQKIDISPLASGVYIVNVRNSSETTTQKIIKE